MPRPKRSKVPPSAPTRVASSIPKHVTQEAQNKVFSVPGKSTASSDDSDGLVVNKRTSNRTRTVIKTAAYMSGALERKSGDARDLDLQFEKEAAPLATEASKAISRKDTRAHKRDEKQDRPRKGQRKATDEAVPASQTPEEGCIVVASSLQQELHHDAQSEDNVPESQQAETSSAKATHSAQRSVAPGPQPSASNWRTHATPRSSILSLANFKRRPRQPSLLRLGRQDDDNDGASLSPGDLSHFNAAWQDDLDGFDDYEAEAPLHPIEHNEDAAPLNEKQASSPVLEPEAHTSSSSRKRKHASPAVLVRRSESPEFSSPLAGQTDARNRDEDAGGPPQVELDSEQDEDGDEEPILPPPSKRRTISPVNRWDDTMAPPRSSSPERTQQPVKGTKIASRRTDAAARGRPLRSAAAEIEPSKTRKQSSKENHEPIATADLRHMLPRRRRTQKKARDQSDVATSDIESDPVQPDEDEDELSSMPSKKKKKGGGSGKRNDHESKQQRRPLKPAKNARQLKQAPTNASKTKSPGKSSKTAAKPANALAISEPRRISRTYSRRSNDKENEPSAFDEDDSDEDNNDGDEEIGDVIVVDSAGQRGKLFPKLNFSPVAAKRLQAARNYFADVDRFELDFERDTGSSSSPKDAR